MATTAGAPTAQSVAATPIAVSAAVLPAPRFALLAPLQVRNYALLWSGNFVSMAGDQFQAIALAILALDLTHSAAALGGVLIAPITTTGYSIGLLFSLKGFAAAIVGGMGSSLGAVVGGLALGLVESLSTGMISSGYKDAISLGILMLFLLLRPQGLPGPK